MKKDEIIFVYTQNRKFGGLYGDFSKKAILAGGVFSPLLYRRYSSQVNIRSWRNRRVKAEMCPILVVSKRFLDNDSPPDRYFMEVGR